jgi:hypothetical protein
MLNNAGNTGLREGQEGPFSYSHNSAILVVRASQFTLHSIAGAGSATSSAVAPSNKAPMISSSVAER